MLQSKHLPFPGLLQSFRIQGRGSILPLRSHREPAQKRKRNPEAALMQLLGRNCILLACARSVVHGQKNVTLRGSVAFCLLVARDRTIDGRTMPNFPIRGGKKRKIIGRDLPERFHRALRVSELPSRTRRISRWRLHRQPRSFSHRLSARTMVGRVKRHLSFRLARS